MPRKTRTLEHKRQAEASIIFVNYMKDAVTELELKHFSIMHQLMGLSNAVSSIMADAMKDDQSAKYWTDQMYLRICDKIKQREERNADTR